MNIDEEPLGLSRAVALLAMPLSAIYVVIAVALLLFGLAQALGLVHRAATGRGSSWLWFAVSSLFWFAAECGLLAIVLHGTREYVTPSNLSSPYPEMSFLVLSVAVLWLGYALYRLWRRRGM